MGILVHFQDTEVNPTITENCRHWWWRVLTLGHRKPLLWYKKPQLNVEFFVTAKMKGNGWEDGSVGKARPRKVWRSGSRDRREFQRLGLVYAVNKETLPQTRWKVSARIPGSPQASTHVPWHACACIHTHKHACTQTRHTPKDWREKDRETT